MEKVAKKGRKCLYEEKVLPALDMIKCWAMDGLTDEEMAKKVGVSISSFNKYKAEKKEFSDLLKKNKEYIDNAVELALVKQALGGNVTAQIFWLKNRRRDKWRDRVDNQVEVKGTATILETLSDEELRNLAKDNGG